MFQALAGGMRPALTAGPIRGLTQHDWFMRQLLAERQLLGEPITVLGETQTGRLG
jgi:hypothetical protein